MTTKKEEYVSETTSQLDAWDEEIKEWQSKAEHSEAEVDTDARAQLGALQKQSKALRRRVEELQGLGIQAWDEAVKGAQKMRNELKQSMGKARGLFS